ncbi:methyltransferase domain-containing protein [Streptomyces sp. NA02950]|uniref:class I SAM-dependent methyltransferase n=1 Tax=Streptomyces sp. NA02950 TaxID=2742137 RepID=UPI001591A099|nr:methyltransferase domain-containing protein [Streptomyces sp. NA02950]QKV96726.1 methyltransferase domain-containing protein [Streptomyces sp. NA02950]
MPPEKHPGRTPRLLDAAFGRPRGPAGTVGGGLMARFNASQERWAVDRAALRPGERVLVVGPGPGVGLAPAVAAVEPGGRVIAVDPSATMRRAAIRRCAAQIAAGTLRVDDGTAERTGCPDAAVDAVLSVNNVMLWDRPAGFRELLRVLRPGGRMVLTVHRHVLGFPPERLVTEATGAGFGGVELTLRDRRVLGPAVQLLLHHPGR